VDLSQTQNHARVVRRLIFRFAAVTALLHTPHVAAQAVPSGRSGEGMSLNTPAIAASTAPGAPAQAPPVAAGDSRMRLQLAAESPPSEAAVAPVSPSAEQPIQIVVKTRLNGVAKRDFIVYMAADGDFFLTPSDLVEMGVAKPAGSAIDIGGVPYVSLKSIPGAKLRFDEKTLTLDIELPPDMLPRESFNLGAKLPATPIQPRAPGGFLNYQLGRTFTQSGEETYNGTTELGVNVGKFLLLDDHVYTTSSEQNHAVRLQTRLLYDQPEELRRWTVGDAAVASGELGSAFNFGGIGVSKLYQINPYFIKAPQAGFSGAVALPSTVDVYMNGARVESQSLAPGAFNLQNLNYQGATGLNTFEFVIKDPFGREQTVSFPYFFSDQLLAKGLDEYSYNVGAIRNNYGVSSNDYGHAVASAFHRYGVSDTLTLGLSGDATADHINVGPQAILNTVKAGVVTVGLAVSHDSDGSTQSGSAALANHTFLSGPFSTQLFARRFTEDYTVIGITPTDKPKFQGSAGISYGTSNTGTFSLNYAVQTVYDGATDQRTTTLGYTRTLAGNISVSANVSRISDTTTGYAAFVGISYFPASGVLANASHLKTREGNTADQIQYSKTPPIGEGLGYRVLAQRSESAGAVSDSVSPFVQYNARNAILTAEGTTFVSGAAGGSDFYQLSVAGAAAYIGNDVYFSRPINDSYAVVKIEPPLSGVRVLKSSADIGVTDATGTAFVPDLGSYQVNEVSIQTKDIPLDYTVTKSTQKIRPPLRSGVLATFDMLRVRAITGRLKIRRDGIETPLENYELVLTGKTATARLSTIRGGEFYIEDLAPGRYSAELKVGEKACNVEVTVPDSKEIVTDLGDIFCESLH
jgi:outer membrane usher protein